MWYDCYIIESFLTYLNFSRENLNSSLGLSVFRFQYDSVLESLFTFVSLCTKKFITYLYCLNL